MLARFQYMPSLNREKEYSIITSLWPHNMMWEPVSNEYNEREMVKEKKNCDDDEDEKKKKTEWKKSECC